MRRCFIQCVNYYINHHNVTSWSMSWRIILFCYCIMIQCSEFTMLDFYYWRSCFCWSVLDSWKVFMFINLLSWNLKRSKVILSLDMMHECWYYLSFLCIVDWPENKSKVLKYVLFLWHFFMHLRDILYVTMYNGYVLYVLVSKYVRQNFECIGCYFLG